MQDMLFDPIPIRYEGIDADRHEIELGSFGESIQGISRILATTGNFALTETFVKKLPAHDVRVLVRTTDHHCFEVVAVLKSVLQHPIGGVVFSGIGTALLTALVSYVFAKASGRKQEMEHLRSVLEVAIKELGNRDQKHIDRLLQVIEKMSDALSPSARKAVSPVGESCANMRIGKGEHNPIIIDKATKDSMFEMDEKEILPEKIYHIKIREIDLDKKTCRIVIIEDGNTEEEDAQDRIKGIITDPAIGVPNNIYVSSMALDESIHIKAKAVIKGGELDVIYISDAVK